MIRFIYIKYFIYIYLQNTNLKKVYLIYIFKIMIFIYMN